MRLALIDNYDSFTWNLFHYLEPLCSHIQVYRNDEFDISQLLSYQRIVISPGPGMPSEVPILKKVILDLGQTIPILGVCLGHQAIVEAFGGSLKNLDTVWHGITRNTQIVDTNELLFKNLPKNIVTGHYHSWVVNPANLPNCLTITAQDTEGEIMAVSHKQLNIKGVQFHPESVLTPYGRKIIENWVKQ